MTNEPNLEGDVVLIFYQDKPSAYARIEAIEPDVKKDWYQVTLLLLTIPSQTVNWILREEYINGDPFTMGGNAMRLEKVQRLPSKPSDEGDNAIPEIQGSSKSQKVVPFKRKT